MNNKLLPHWSTTELLHTLDILSSSDFDFELAFTKMYSTGRPRLLTLYQLLECLELKRSYSCNTWKGLYNCVIDNRSNWNIPCYSNFLKNLKSLLLFLYRLIKIQMLLNQIEFFSKPDKIAYIDSTPLPVCKVIRSARHKTMVNYAQYSKSTAGWYYGLKLHVVTNYTNNKVIYLSLSGATTDDRVILKQALHSNIFYNSETMFVADKGYQSKELESIAYHTGNYLLTGKRKSKNMRILASWFDIYTTQPS